MDVGTGDWGPVQQRIAACARLGYTAARYGLGHDVVVLVTGPEGTRAPSRPPAPSGRSLAPVVIGVGNAGVTLDHRGRPATVRDVLGETWTVDAVTGVWVQLGPVPAAAGVRTAWRLRLACWHTPPAPGAAAVLEHRADGSWWLRPPR